jgi:ketol-acid reductoisomerase
MSTIYYDQDADLADLVNERITIIGYGIQGRNQALNMRDSGLEVIIGNINDRYAPQALADGFELLDPKDAAQRGSIIYMLIPDDAQEGVYSKCICDHLTEGKALVFAHGFAVRYGRIVPPKNVDLMLLAPRMPGKQIREYFLAGTGAPVFVGVGQDFTGRAKRRVLAMAKAIGATRVGSLEVGFEEETEVDHFIEHYLLPVIVRAIAMSYECLVNAGYSREVALLETYASGEIGELLLGASKTGLYKVFQDNTSPTAQFGMAYYAEQVFPDSQKEVIKKIIENIKDGTFAEILKTEGRDGYPRLKSAVEKNNSSDLMRCHAALTSELGIK